MAATDPTNFTREQIEALGGVISGNVGKARVLTTADYNWPTTGTKTSVALWLLDSGIYAKDYGVNVSINISTTANAADNLFVIKKDTNYGDSIFVASRDQIRLYRVDPSSGGGTSGYPKTFLMDKNVVDNLTSAYTTSPLSANQGKVLKDLIDGLAISGAGAPTASTVGTVGKLYEDTTNGDLYICTDATNPYVWEEVGSGGGSGPTVVQTTGTSTTDVMSQNAVTSMVFADPSTKRHVLIGGSASINSEAYGVSIGSDTYNRGGGSYSAGIAIGRDARVRNGAENGVAIGMGADASQKGQFDIGTSRLNTTAGYNNSAYRLLTGLYDPQSDHDAATKGYVDGLVGNIASALNAINNGGNN